jgi:hypothetical protein
VSACRPRGVSAGRPRGVSAGRRIVRAWVEFEGRPVRLRLRRIVAVGAGRAKLRRSRASRVDLPCDVNPSNLDPDHRETARRSYRAHAINKTTPILRLGLPGLAYLRLILPTASKPVPTATRRHVSAPTRFRPEPFPLPSHIDGFIGPVAFHQTVLHVD